MSAFGGIGFVGLRICFGFADWSNAVLYKHDMLLLHYVYPVCVEYVLLLLSAEIQD